MYIGRQALSLSGAIHKLMRDAYCCFYGHEQVKARCNDKYRYQISLSVGLTQIIYIGRQTSSLFGTVHNIVQDAC